jgi:hypothetical protein
VTFSFAFFEKKSVICCFRFMMETGKREMRKQSVKMAKQDNNKKVFTESIELKVNEQLAVSRNIRK